MEIKIVFSLLAEVENSPHLIKSWFSPNNSWKILDDVSMLLILLVSIYSLYKNTIMEGVKDVWLQYLDTSTKPKVGFIQTVCQSQKVVFRYLKVPVSHSAFKPRSFPVATSCV